MKKILTLCLILSFGISLFAQQIINFHVTDAIDSYQIYEGDSIYFNTEHTTLFFFNGGEIKEYSIEDVDSVSFTKDLSENVYIEFLASGVNVNNPLESEGVSIISDGAVVTITSTSSRENINYICSGNTEAGMLKIYSDEKFNLIFNDLNIANPSGPAINIQSKEKAFIHLVNSSVNSVTDGNSYDDPIMVNGNEEDQKAAFFSEGKLEFIGGGAITVYGMGEDKHGINSDKGIIIEEGSITVASSQKDGIHADGLQINGGTVMVQSSGDGIDGDDYNIEINCGNIEITSTADDVKGITCDSILVINGGTITLNISGNQSKGLKSKMDILLNGGTISGSAEGDAVLEEDGSGFDPSYCTLIKGDEDVIIDGAMLDIFTTGKGSRGISSDGNLMILDGAVSIVSSGDGDTYTNADGQTDAYHGACIKVDEDLMILGGNIVLSNSGSGGRGISVDGDIVYGDGTVQPVMEITTTGESITISQGGGGPGGFGGNDGDYDEAKTMKADGSITINSGVLQISSADDGIKAEGSITFNQGEITIDKSVEGVEAPVINVNDGVIRINASDDGFNATYGNGGEQNDGSKLNINGGYIYVSASNGDALDSNGDIAISGGIMVIHGPQSSPEVGMDVNGSATITGGFVIISGTSSNMTEGFSSSSSQNSVLMRTNQSQSAGKLIHLEDANGNNLFTFQPIRSYASLIFSSPLLTNASGYKLYTGGSSDGTVEDGLYDGGTYTPGTLVKTFSVSSSVTSVSF
ncbi:MAG: carbohydrate-binding domain-containing protein [Saprospiraceae bacterium]|nr:carbohydrate-binding domain-containing protein [Saprospiraceae bacterium]